MMSDSLFMGYRKNKVLGKKEKKKQQNHIFGCLYLLLYKYFISFLMPFQSGEVVILSIPLWL